MSCRKFGFGLSGSLGQKPLPIAPKYSLPLGILRRSAQQLILKSRIAISIFQKWTLSWWLPIVCSRPILVFFGSSGILGHACRLEKPMIACEEGLLGELVRELEVGLTVNPRDSGALANCLRVALKGELPGNTVAAARYTKAADYRKFSETLIADWNE